MQTSKAHSASKQVLARSPELSSKILATTAKIAKIVGDTLGPGGHPVLIERQESDLPPIVTKDGVTVFKSLGFEDSIEQNILECTRDASVKTAQEAGDGTTTATILMEAFTRLTHQYCDRNPNVPPIQVIRKIQHVYETKLLKVIEDCKISCKFDKKGQKLLHSVAKLSANGDEALADAVMDAFKICGDDGNVTILDVSGPSKYEVEKLDGYPIGVGYEDSCGKYYPLLINDPANQKIMADKPMFLLYFGRITDVQTVVPILEKLTILWTNGDLIPHNIVIVALGFSEAVLQQFALMATRADQLKIYPLVVPQTAITNGQRSFLDDLSAVTGAKVFDPMTAPIEDCTLDPNYVDEVTGEQGRTDVGNLKLNHELKWTTVGYDDEEVGVKYFECGRYRSTIVGFCNPEKVLERQEQVKKLAKAAESKLEADMITERAAKLTGSIAKLKVIGSSNGELKERRDRAEDAVCAVRGALKDGALIGGGWTLVKMAECLDLNDPIENEIIQPALWEPVFILYNNAGLLSIEDSDEAKHNNQVYLAESFESAGSKDKLQDIVVRDISNGNMVKAVENGILDSLPAVKEALKNAISIATLLGTLGGCVVFGRDKEIDKMETKSYSDFVNNVKMGNMADERAM